MSGYLTRLLEAYQSGQIEPGVVTQVEVIHEPKCPALEGGACACDPALTIAVTTGDPGPQGGNP